MPVIQIQALVREPPDLPRLLGETARAVARAVSTDEKNCWAVFREIPPGAYFEGGKVRGKEDALLVSPLVTILARAGRTAEQKAAALRAAARAVGEALGSDPENVFVDWREIPEGHVFTGGQVL